MDLRDNFTHSPEFTGVFIPASVWLNREINCVERCLLAEIGALGGHRGECRAGNEFLGKHVGVSGHRVSVMIAKLIDLNLVEMVSFDGRVRKLRVFYDTKADFVKKQRQTLRKQLGCPVENAKEETSYKETNKLEEEGAVAPSVVANEPKEATLSLNRKFSDEWCKAYEEKFGGKYAFQGGRDGKAVASLMKFGTPEELIALAKKAWGQTDPQKFWNCINHSSTISKFLNGLPSIRVELSRAKTVNRGQFCH